MSTKMGPIGCPETSLKVCHYSLHKVPEKFRSHLLGGGSMELHICSLFDRCLSLRCGSSRHEGNATRNTDKENAALADVSLVSTVQWHVNK